MTERRILGKYEIIKELGRGGFGIVYEARDKVLDRHVALKALHGQFASDPLFLERFEQEAKLAAQLEHPNLVPVYDFGQDKGYNYITMGLMKSGSLKDHIEKNGALESQQAKKVFEQVLEGVSYIHQNDVIHRDLKPSNILFDQHGTARISDLGFAKAVRSDVSSSMSTSGGMVGTAAYMAPEIWHGNKATEQTDIYSLGCIAYEMLTGKMLFFGDTPAEIMTRHLIVGPQMDAKLPEPWRKLIEKCLAKDPTERYQTAKEVLADLKFDLINTLRERVRVIDTVPVTDVPRIEYEALVALYESTNGAGWKDNTNWLQTTTVGNWKGITVSNGHVVRISLMNNHLKGTIPIELGLLTNLLELKLSYNKLTGTIPNELGKLTNLTYFGLSENQLTDTIPIELGNLKNLTECWLYNNELTGTIPVELGKLSNLVKLVFHTNQLTGSIPVELGHLSNLRVLSLKRNKLTGTIPASIGKLTELRVLELSNNQLTGSIPVELGNLSNLETLRLLKNKSKIHPNVKNTWFN